MSNTIHATASHQGTSTRQTSTAQQASGNQAQSTRQSGQTQNASTASHDSVTLSAATSQAAPGGVDPARQQQETGAQQQEIDARAAAGEDVSDLRPASQQDVEHYNNLLAEASSLAPGSHDQDGRHVEVTEEDGVRRLQFEGAGGMRTVTFDTRTGSLSESTLTVGQTQGFQQPNFVRTNTQYERRGDVLGPVRSDEQRPAPEAPTFQQIQQIQQQIQNAQHYPYAPPYGFGLI